MSTTTTTIAAENELRTNPQLSKDASPLPSAFTSSNHLDNNFSPSEPLNIIEASRIADSTVPEGGYGWVVITGCAILTWWYLGMSYSWGIMQSALVERGLAPASTLSWIGSLCVTFNSIGALVWARFIRVVGTRQAALVGIVCLGGGSVLSGFCTQNIGGLFFTSGVIMGLGTRYIQNLPDNITAKANSFSVSQSLFHACLCHASAILQQKTGSGYRYNLCSRWSWRHSTEPCDEWPYRKSRPCLDISNPWIYDLGNRCASGLSYKRTSAHQEKRFH